jgi:preprotein translocase subunit SecG
VKGVAGGRKECHSPGHHSYNLKIEGLKDVFKSLLAVRISLLKPRTVERRNKSQGCGITDGEKSHSLTSLVLSSHLPSLLLHPSSVLLTLLFCVLQLAFSLLSNRETMTAQGASRTMDTQLSTEYQRTVATTLCPCHLTPPPPLCPFHLYSPLSTPIYERHHILPQKDKLREQKSSKLAWWQ